MAWFNWGNKSPEVKVSKGSWYSIVKNFFPDWKQEDYVKEGYSKEPIVYACANLLASSFARVPLKVRNKKRERVEGHPIEMLLKNPNIGEGGVEFRQSICLWYLLTGNVFIQKLKSGDKITELYVWQPYDWRVIRKAGNPLPRAYVHGNGASEETFEVDNTTGECEIIHWSTFNPSKENPDFGLSPIKAACNAIDSANSAREWNYSSTQNSGGVSLLVTTEQPRTPAQEKTVEETLNEEWSGPRNANKVKFMSGATKAQQVSLSPKDMEWLQGLKLSSQEICAVMGVPTQLLGIEGSQTYANFEEAKLSVHTNRICPLLDLFVSELNRSLPLDDGEEIYYDENDIPALEPLRRERRKELAESKDLTLNERREALGFPRRDEPEADMIMSDAGLVPFDEVFDDDDSDIDDDENG